MKTKLNIEAFPDEFIESLVYKDNIKTINGNSILGEGDISISQSNNDEILQLIQELQSQVYENENVTALSLTDLMKRKFDKIKIVYHNNSETECLIEPNKFHIWNEINSLTLYLGEGEDDIVNEYMIQFSSGSNGATLTLPNNIKWSDDIVPDFSDTSFIYQISIVNRCATMLKFKL